MRQIGHWIVGLVLLSAVVAAAIWQGSGRAMSGRGWADTITLVYAADVRGIMVACGCPGGFMGGLAKRHTVIAELRKAYPNLVVVDSGGSLVGRVAVDKIPYLMKAIAAGEYDAVTLGEGCLERLAAEQCTLSDLTAGGGVPLVCGNIEIDGIPPWRVVEKGSYRIGILQLFGDRPNLWKRYQWQKRFGVSPTIDTARKLCAELRQDRGCHLVVAMTRQNVALDRELARAVPEIDVIVGGHDGVLLREPIREGRTLIVQAGAGGHFVGTLHIRMKNGAMGDVRNELTALSSQVPAEESVVALYREYRKKAGLKAAEPEDDLVIGQFKGARQCRSCHEAQYDDWCQTRHASAIKTIEYADRADDPECKFCHTMGFRRKTGFRSTSETPQLAAVTCQACHLPGKESLEGREPECRDTEKARIGAQVCRSCHTIVTSPAFDFQQYLERISHRSVEASPSNVP